LVAEIFDNATNVTNPLFTWQFWISLSKQLQLFAIENVWKWFFRPYGGNLTDSCKCDFSKVM